MPKAIDFELFTIYSSILRERAVRSLVSNVSILRFISRGSFPYSFRWLFSSSRIFFVIYTLYINVCIHVYMYVYLYTYIHIYTFVYIQQYSKRDMLHRFRLVAHRIISDVVHSLF